MRVYVESNFILEVAFLQEESDYCERILDLAEEGKISLVLPASCITEPYETLIRRRKQRDDLQSRLSLEFAQLARSKPYEEVVRGSSEVVAVLGKAGEESKTRLEDTLSRVLAFADIVHVDRDRYAEALRLQIERGLGPQDAIVYACVLYHLTQAPSDEQCFLNRNAKDFLTPEIEEDLHRLHCRLIPSFANGLGFIESSLSRL